MKKTVWTVCLLLCLSLVLLAGCGKENKQPDSGLNKVGTYTVTVCAENGQSLEGVTVFVYEDSTKAELVTVGNTDAQGKMSFTDKVLETYVAVLDKLPTGYVAEELYPLTGLETTILLKTGEMTQDNMAELRYKLGDAMMDFTVTDAEGNSYSLSALLAEKKAVVLNFFYNECQPCMSEFPYLQEAYAQYSDKIAVLAMNPVNDDPAKIAQLQKELGVTFPMVACDPLWEKVMQITAYPTTVVIDRLGNICLIHKGSVPDTKTFADTFAYFTADDYEQKLIEAIGDLRVEEPEGTKENPTEIGGVDEFEVTVEAGKEVYLNIYKVTKMYLQIESDNAYIIYKGKTYEPEDGEVSVLISVPDTFTPTEVIIGNSGDKTETFKAKLAARKGSFNNPYKLTLGDFTAKVTAGNEQGVYYTYTAPADGTLTLKCVDAPSGIKYGYYLFNTKTSAMRNLESDSVTGENGEVTVSIQAKKGQKLQVCISTLPDDKGTYPAANLKFNAAFTEGEIKEEEKEQTTDYTVTVKDDEQLPLANVSILVTVGEEQKPYTTNAEGVATITLPTGSYEGSFYVPDGYRAETTAFTLTAEAPNVAVTLTKIKMTQYTVTVADSFNAPVSQVLVKFGDGQWLTTDENGKVVQTLETGTYAVTVMIPDGYTGQTAYTVTEEAPNVTVTLGYPEGSQQNPLTVSAYPFTTPQIAAGGELYCVFTQLPDTDNLVIEAETAYMRWDGTTYLPEGGKVTLPLSETETELSVVIGNSGTETARFVVFGADQPAPPPPPTVYTYKVTVTDTFGAAQKSIGVMFLKDGSPVQMINTDANGVAVLETETAGEYTVELVFTGKTWYYDKAAAVLTDSKRELTVKLADMIDETDYEKIYILNNNPAYRLYVGGTMVSLGSGKLNFSAEYESNCFYVFTPTEGGTYQITAAPDVEVSLWGSTWYIHKQQSSKDADSGNAVTFSVQNSSAGNVTYVIGVKADTAVTETVINIARIGDPAFSIADQPWTEWKTGELPAADWMNQVGLVAVKNGTQTMYYRLQKTLTYMDYTAPDGTYELYYDEANGFYRLGEDGPILVVDLNAARFVPLYERINGNGLYGGSAVTRYFYNDQGAFIKKEAYTEFLQACFDEVLLDTNDEQGYYPLTKDMMYALQNGFAGWWNPDSPNYLEGFASANPNYAWMFCCGYIQE